MKNTQICLAGDGWGAVAAYESLKKTFNNIDVITNDQAVLDLLNPKHKRIKDFSQTQSEFIICAGYRPIITKEQLLKWTFINIHYSMLPKYRGQHSTVWAILNDEDELGLTIHLMSEYIDDGPVLYQYSIKNDRQNSSTYYMESFNKCVQENLGQVVLDFLEKKISPIPQDKSQATWVGRRYKKDCKIDFHKDNVYLKNFFRALVPPYPLPYIKINKTNKEYSIRKASLIERKINTHIGRILNIDNEGVYVSSKSGYVILEEILDENGSLVDNFQFKIGTFLNTETR